MIKVAHFIRTYPVVTLVTISMIAGLVLALTGHGSAADGLLAVVALLATLPIIKDMIETIRSGGYGLDILALTAIVVGVIEHEYWAAIVIVLMLTGGQALEDYAESRATVELTALLERAPQRAHLLTKNHQTNDVRVEQIKIGDHVLVKPGEVIPVDGTIITGATTLDESSLTGESLPVSKRAGMTVLSGAINLDAPLTIRADQTSDNSQYAQIIKLVREATTSKSPFVRLADRYSLPFTLVSFAIAGIVWALTGDLRRFLEVIVVATPCPLLIGAPIAIVSGMSRGAKHGIIMKNGAALERLAAVRSIAFDKTGTLTKGTPVVERVVVLDHLSEAELLALAAGVERHSAHILAQAVVEAAAERKITPAKVSGIHEVPGYGLRAMWRGAPVLVGTQALLEREAVKLPATLASKVDLEQTTALVAIDGRIAGALTFTDRLREESAPTIQKLRVLGVDHISLLTGDRTEVANHLADELGITQVYAELLPADKVDILKHLSDDARPIGMVGDGVNDAPVLAASDVGIALGARGSTAASESADVVIMLDDLTRVARAVEIAKETIRIGLQSIWIGIALSVGLMLVFATGKFSPVLGAGVQEVVDVVVIINALRAHGSFRTRTAGRISNQIESKRRA